MSLYLVVLQVFIPLRTVCRQDVPKHNHLLISALALSVEELVKQLHRGVELEVLAVLRPEVGSAYLHRNGQSGL